MNELESITSKINVWIDEKTVIGRLKNFCNQKYNIPSIESENYIEDKERINQLRERIKLYDENFVKYYGENYLSNFTYSSAQHILNSNNNVLNESNIIISQAIKEINSFIDECNSKKRIIHLFSKDKKEKSMEQSYQKIIDNMDMVIKLLSENQVEVKRFTYSLTTMYANSKYVCHELDLLIIAGYEKLIEEGKNLTSQYEQSKKELNANLFSQINQKIDMLENFLARLRVLEFSRATFEISNVQLANLLDDANNVKNVLQKTFQTTIPIWKLNISLALGINSSENPNNHEIKDMVEELFRNVSELNIELCLNQSGIYDVKSAKEVNKKLLDTLVLASLVVEKALKQV